MFDAINGLIDIQNEEKIHRKTIVQTKQSLIVGQCFNSFKCVFLG